MKRGVWQRFLKIIIVGEAGGNSRDIRGVGMPNYLEYSLHNKLTDETRQGNAMRFVS